MPEKLDPRLMSIWDKERQFEKRRNPKQPISREKCQTTVDEQGKFVDEIRRKRQDGDDLGFIISSQSLSPEPNKNDSQRWMIPSQSRKPNTSSDRGAEEGRRTPAPAAAQTSPKGLPPLYECAERLKEKVHLVFYQKNLYAFNGRCYDLLSSDDVIRLYRDRVDNQLGGEKSLWAIKQLYQYLLTDTSIAVEKVTCDQNQRVAVLRNGVYDVMRGRLRKHNHKDLVFSWVDAEYCEDGRCKHFRKFLRDVTGGDEILQERLWQAIGYMLTQSTEAKAFFVMGTAPNSGKSLLGNFIESLFDERYVSNIALNAFHRPFELAPIAGAAINVSLDLPAVRLNADAVSMVKQITGDDGFNVNPKHVSPFRYRSRAKLLFATNFPVELLEWDEAFWNRLVYLPFDYSVPRERQDFLLPERFQQERDAIVSEALRHVKPLVENHFQFPTTTRLDQRIQEWQGKRCASIENFLRDCCVLDGGLRGELMDTLFNAYDQYCDAAGLVAKSRPVFKHFLENHVGLKHFKMRDGGENPRSAFRGIKLAEVRYD